MFLQLQQYIIEHESAFRLSSFILVLIILLVVETFRPRRKPGKSNNTRRINNGLLLLVNYLAARLLVPLATWQVAIFASENDIGLFNLVSIPVFFNVLITIVIFDLLIYIQHVVFHKVKLLWKVHRVHHTDLAFDVTTGIRFHPFEIVLSMFYKLLATLLLGPAAFAIILYEILLNAAALFTHSNIYINSEIDRFLRKILVTPDMHRIHHSIEQNETDSNYGNIFPFWDKLFKTYRTAPRAGYDGMVIGLNEFRDESYSKLYRILKIPFIKI